jgi:hypothetical protein
VFGSRFWANQAHEVQASGVWLPAPPPESGSLDAISLPLSAFPETPETASSCLHPPLAGGSLAGGSLARKTEMRSSQAISMHNVVVWLRAHLEPG